MSNCVLNLVPDKAKAFAETFRILKPGGHFSVSDIVLTGELPEGLRDSAEMYAGCISGAIQKDEYLKSSAMRASAMSSSRKKEKSLFRTKFYPFIWIAGNRRNTGRGNWVFTALPCMLRNPGKETRELLRSRMLQ